MAYKKILILLLSFVVIKKISAQNDSAVFAKYATKAAHTKLYQNLIKNSINKNLSLSLNDSTEDNWQQAFWAMATIGYSSPWVYDRVLNVSDSLQNRSINFQRAFIEFIYTNYPSGFTKQVISLLDTNDPKLFALCYEYLLRSTPVVSFERKTKEIIKNRFEQMDNPIIRCLQSRLQPSKPLSSGKALSELFKKDFLEGNVIMYSIQRKNRDYPGIAIIRKSDGSFTKDSTGNIFYVPQLARSVTNLPYYLTNGNTPQGIFRMFGFDISNSNFIGPTTNVQLIMPAETSTRHFMNDSTLMDSIWTIDLYKQLLPEKLKGYAPLFESYYAGEAGRTEIIAHGSTINPEYYKTKTWYPLTPSLGCLCTREEWDEQTGKRLYSDQQKLVDALQAAGGADGYCIVIEVDDKEMPVSIDEILPLIPQ